MTLLYSPEQEEFRSAIRRFLDQHAPESRSANGRIRRRDSTATSGVTWP